MLNINCDRGSVNFDFCIESLSLSLSQRLLGSHFVTFWVPFGASWQPIGLVLEPFASFSRHLASLLDRLGEASGGRYDFGCQNYRFGTSFWCPKSMKNCSELPTKLKVIFGND